MTDTITITGLVATEPRHLTTGEGLAITSFRLASSQRRYDRKTNTWSDAGTNWYTVSTFRRLALGAAASVAKGDRVIVTGRLRLRDWQNAEKSGMSIEIDADALGHDLNWGTASYTRTMSPSAAAAMEEATPDDPQPTDAAPAGEADTADAAGAGLDEFPVAVDTTPDTPF